MVMVAFQCHGHGDGGHGPKIMNLDYSLNRGVKSEPLSWLMCENAGQKYDYKCLVLSQFTA